MPTVRIDPDLYQRLQEIQQETGVPIARQVNRLLKEHLPKQGRAKRTP